MEVGSVQHEEDREDVEPRRIQSDLQNNTVGANMSSAKPSQQQFELIKNQSHTHDYNFFSGASAQLLNRNSEQGNSTLFEFTGQATNSRK